MNIEKLLKSYYPTPYISLNNYALEKQTANLLSKEICLKHKIIPIEKLERNNKLQTISLGLVDAENTDTWDLVEKILNCNVSRVLISDIELNQAIEKYF